MKPLILASLSYLLIIGIAEAEAAEFAHFLEPGFPFAEIVVDARHLGGGFPQDNLTPRGLVVRLAEDTYIAYDTDLCRVAVAWKGGFLTAESLATMSYQDAQKKKGGGQAVLPSPVGKPIFATGLYPGVQVGGEVEFRDPRPAGKDPQEIGRGALPEGMARWESVTACGAQAVVHYSIGGVGIAESPFLASPVVLGRGFAVEAHPDSELTIILGNGQCLLPRPPAGARLLERDGVHCLTLGRTGEATTFAVLQSDREIPPALADKSFPLPNETGGSYWQDACLTRGWLSEVGSESYVVDAIDLPTDNPQRRSVRPTGIDFFPDGTAVVCTFDGDVWTVSGLDEGLGAVRWKRIAGGLHEPCSVSVEEGGGLLVFGRNGITRLRPAPVDPGAGGSGSEDPWPGETRWYENFCSDFWQSAETRDFAHSMAIAGDRSILITKGGQQNDFASKHSGRVLKISPDGKEVRVFASGLRNAYLTIRPGTDEIYASDQQGHWVPATPVHRIVEGGYYGFQPAAPWGVPEPPITPPLCWIPHAVAGSGLGPVWSDRQRFGPLSDSLIYLDFRRPGLLRTYLDGRPGQAATVPMPTVFDFPLLKGAVNPIDGQLYLVGFQIWGTSAKQVRGMARLRYTGKPSALPTRVVAGKNAVVLRFNQPLDPAIASFTVRRWNYRRSSGYGSGHFRPDGKAGEEILASRGIAFSADRRSVLVATPELQPVHQLAVSYDLRTAAGRSFSNAAYLTLQEISPLDLAEEGFPDTELAMLAATNPGTLQATDHPAKPSADRGSVVFNTIGCAACHSVDGSTDGKSGPTWKGLAGSKRQLEGGTEAEATGSYLRESILDPAAKVTRGYNPKDVGMPSYRGILSEADIDSLILYIESLAN